MNSQAIPRAYRRPILIWIASICGLVVLTLIVGGATRLTNSGLSITEWKPLIGALPPLSEADWMRTFELYKQIPEYSIEHSQMDLAGFKFIFFWEYLHRNMGRLIGLVFLFPFLFFWLRGALPRPLFKRVLLGFFLGGLQGGMGWFMVMSGLSERTDVSHYRLAAHLGLAIFIFYHFFQILLELLSKSEERLQKRNLKVSRNILILQILLSLQIIYGAFVAGLRAGYSYNTFPKMNGDWFPSLGFSMQPLFINFFENPALVQFIHRWLGAGLVLGIFIFILMLPKSVISPMAKKLMNSLVIMILIQFLLGVFALLSHLSFAIALIHQFGALVVFALLQSLSFSYKRI